MDIIHITSIHPQLPSWISEARSYAFNHQHCYFEARQFLKIADQSCYFTTLIPSQTALDKSVDLLFCSGENKAFSIVGDMAISLSLDEYKEEAHRIEEMERNGLKPEIRQELFTKQTMLPNTIAELQLLKLIALSEKGQDVFINKYYEYYDDLNERRESMLKEALHL